ncbi:MFS transporter [Herbiconiux sp. A18JL235]|uniref:MFS transporter n=1 Tax=Herbiconiux sp. A18JL235 TaxID=3152363 RepID=A0AB39BG76_9MICO
MTSAIGFRSERGPILIALMLTMGVVAVEATVLATAVPTIVGDLGDFALFPWLFSVYLLAQAVTVPIYAKLSDIFGRKPIILVGIGLFLAGSILCGFAWNMPALIVFRALQGLGAGAVMPMTITIAGDIYTIAERAKAQGYLAAVWGISSVVGPTLGGIFSQLEMWRGIFFINIPLCLLAAWMLIRSFKEKVHKRDHRIDYAGAALLTVSMSLLILGVLQGGVSWAWDSWQSIGSFTIGGLLLAAFVLVQTRAAEPVLPLWVFSRRLLLTTTLISLGVGAILIGLTSYVPVYLEGSIGVPPLAAGLALAALTIGWPISGAFAGRFYLRIGFKSTALLGLAVALVGATVLAVTASAPSVALVATACFVIGLGLGVVATPTLIAAQASVEWGDRGVVTGTNQFARAIGSAVGAAVFGAIANAAFGSEADVPAAAIISGGSAVFLAVAVVGVATLGAVVAMPATPVPGRP